MNMSKKSRIGSAALVVLGVSLLASSANAGMPPSRQTPVIVPSDKRDVVEVGPCQLPPCVGGVTCTPNARDYGYYEATWRQWPTQQRYDQKFPEALNSYPINRKNSAISTTEAVPVPAPAGNLMESPQKKQKSETNSITIPDDAVPTPAMGNFEGLSTTPSPTIITEPARKVDPLLDYSSNSVPGISTAPAVSNTPDTSSNLSPFPISEPVPAAAPALEAAPAPAPAPAEAPALEAAPAPAEAPALDADPVLEAVPAPAADDMELTPPTPKKDSPLIEPSENSDDSLSLPLSQGSQNGEEHSIIVSQREQGMNPYDQATDPYMAAVQVSHEEKVQVSSEEKPAETLNPFQTAVIPSEVENAPTVQNVQESAPAPVIPEMKPETKRVGLEGFCPVTLLESEEWVEGKEEWTVMNHGVTYHLANAGQVQKFLANPDAYTPVLDGADPVLFVESGVKDLGNADHCVVFEGKLFMFTNEENLNKFFGNSAAYLMEIQKK